MRRTSSGACCIICRQSECVRVCARVEEEVGAHVAERCHAHFPQNCVCVQELSVPFLIKPQFYGRNHRKLTHTQTNCMYIYIYILMCIISS